MSKDTRLFNRMNQISGNKGEKIKKNKYLYYESHFVSISSLQADKSPLIHLHSNVS